MATTTINGIRLDYPDNPCMIFNPCLFTLTGTMARAKVYVQSGGDQYIATYNTPNGGTLDLRQFMQSFFDGLQMGKDLDGITDIRESELGKTVNLTIFAQDSDNTTLAQFNVSVFAIWGGLAVGDDYAGMRDIIWFKNFPLTVGIFATASGSVIISGREGENEETTAINTAPAVINVEVNTDMDNFVIKRSFMRQGHPVKVTEYNIKTDDHDEGIYLRWVDRHGFWRYWLFKAGDPTWQAASRFGAFYRNDFSNYASGNGVTSGYGWQGDAGRRQSFTRNDIQPICVPLVDQRTFDMLQDITTSPCVDMFLGYFSQVPKWTAVTIEPGQYTKDVKKPEQDFICNLVLPEIPVQSL